MSLRTVLAHLTPLARKLRGAVLPNGADPALLFDAIVEGAYLVAAADGTVDPTELSSIRQAVVVLSDDEVLGEDIDKLLEDFVELRKTQGEPARCAAVGATLHESQASEDGIVLAAAIAYVSGGLDRRELAVMEKIASAAHVSAATLAVLATSVRDELARRAPSNES